MFAKISIVLTFLAAVQASANERVNIGGKEYFISTEALTWTDAADACHGMQMNMLAIESDEENTAIFDYLHAIDFPENYLWTGGKELNDTATTDGIWTWVDLDLTIDYADWASGQPNPFARHFCVYLSLFSNYWLSGVCGAPNRYICEVYQNGTDGAAI